MNPVLGWALAAAMVALSWLAYGWPGVVMAASVVVFWLLLQFNRAMRVMKNAANAPVGSVPSAVMFNAKLKPGMTMIQIVSMTKSLGRKLSDAPEAWQWADAAGDTVDVYFEHGRCSRWNLTRAADVVPAP